MIRTASPALSLCVFTLLAAASATLGCSSSESGTDGSSPAGAKNGGGGSSGAANVSGASHGGAAVGGSGSSAGAPSAGAASGGASASGGSGAASGGGSDSAGASVGGASNGGASTAGAGGASTAGAGGASTAGAGSGGAGGISGAAGSGGTNLTLLGKFALTWYTFQDNTPVNSSISSSGRVLHPFISVAVPFTLLKDFGGKLDYGDKLYIEFLHNRVMPNGKMHSGWVEIDDYCGDNSDDTYCYQNVGGKKYPNTDLYIGDFTKSGMAVKDGDCTGPGGTGQDVTNVSTGNPGALFITSYGGAELGSGKCGDKVTARQQQLGPVGGGTNECWGYDDQETGGCTECVIGVSCTSK